MLWNIGPLAGIHYIRLDIRQSKYFIYLYASHCRSCQNTGTVTDVLFKQKLYFVTINFGGRLEKWNQKICISLS